MTLAELVRLGLFGSIVLMVLGLGMSATVRDAGYLLRRPGLLGRSLLAMIVIMPAFVIVLRLGFDLLHPIAVALVAIAVSPVPPILPNKAVRAGGDAAYAVGLLAAVSVLAILFVPLAVGLLGLASGTGATVPIGSVALVVVATVLAPLGIGLAIRHYAADFAARVDRPVSLAGTLLLLVGLVLVLVSAWPAMEALIGDGTIAAFAAFVVVGLLVGHLLGGPQADGRTVLALCTATRHPGVAITIAAGNFPDEPAIGPAVLLYLLVAVVLSVPYVFWSRRRYAATAAAGSAGQQL